MSHKELTINYKAQYFQLGNFDDSTDNIWFVIHGYGQLAKYFIRKFKVLDDGKNCVIAPQGLSSFYLDGHSGRVGASWMTKEDRLNDIDNYVNYLTTLYQKVIDQSSSVNINVIGFSQGAATASRWIAQSELRFNKLILWAGMFPPDMDQIKAQDRFQDLEVINVLGKNDPFLNDQLLAEQAQIINSLGIQTDVLKFEGGHDIDSPTLLTLT